MSLHLVDAACSPHAVGMDVDLLKLFSIGCHTHQVTSLPVHLLRLVRGGVRVFSDADALGIDLHVCLHLLLITVLLGYPTCTSNIKQQHCHSFRTVTWSILAARHRQSQ